ncbi:ribbon-helix-helix domain-containing protein [Candidatus Atribacteria bacterium 1244-E10-H5-B2]|nr:MAG: ribbon-helix-helix domain-containing protein [Candidatus Atribacteria bacterium 1244-E10-H5-B2]
MKKRTGESIKDLILGEDLHKKKTTSKTVKQHTSKTVKRQADIPARKNGINKKVTYYIDPALIKKLKYLSVKKERDLSSLVSKAIKDLIKKYE